MCYCVKTLMRFLVKKFNALRKKLCERKLFREKGLI
uniref:Uncharacterized protein n=1 Tax=Siphoviridae sp. cttOT32 TaxID=2826493 RepID=A0A8S5QNN7_9CAUD|nr:MAG TPA: hypothetical protein [Siphoviridae sp. cttOT32]